MKQLFHISNDQELPVQAVLALEAGAGHLSWAITNAGGSELYRLGYYHTGGTTAEMIEELLEKEPVLGGSFYAVQICWAFSPGTLVPFSRFQPENAGELFKALFGPTGYSPVITEAVPVWQVQNVYTVPAGIEKKIKELFPAARFRNQFSLFLNIPVEAAGAGNLQVHFRADEMIVLLTRNGQLLLAQEYGYKTPEDVLFILLRCCEKFGLPQSELQFSFSGLIDPDSALYRELVLYFGRVEPAVCNWQETGHPAHYFTSLNALSACAS